MPQPPGRQYWEPGPWRGTSPLIHVQVYHEFILFQTCPSDEKHFSQYESVIPSMGKKGTSMVVHLDWEWFHDKLLHKTLGLSFFRTWSPAQDPLQRASHFTKIVPHYCGMDRTMHTIVTVLLVVAAAVHALLVAPISERWQVLCNKCFTAVLSPTTFCIAIQQGSPWVKKEPFWKCMGLSSKQVVKIVLQLRKPDLITLKSFVPQIMATDHYIHVYSHEPDKWINSVCCCDIASHSVLTIKENAASLKPRIILCFI